MSREEGFAVMDVSTSVCDDPKFRRLARDHQEHCAVAFVVWIATLAESWRTGRRESVADAWPSILPYSDDVVTAMKRVGLIDKSGRVPAKSWADWFGPALERRQRSRDRWARYNAKREADTALVPRGSDAVATRSPRRNRAGTATSVPPVPTVGSSLRASARENGAQEGHAKRGGEPVSLTDALVGYGLDERIAGKKP